MTRGLGEGFSQRLEHGEGQRGMEVPSRIIVWDTHAIRYIKSKYYQCTSPV